METIYIHYLCKTRKENAPSELLNRAHLHAEPLEATIRYFNSWVGLKLDAKCELVSTSAFSKKNGERTVPHHIVYRLEPGGAYIVKVHRLAETYANIWRKIVSNHRLASCT